MSVIDEVVNLLDRGFRPYHDMVDGPVYERLHCERPKRAKWFMRADDMACVCLGCRRRCSVASGQGFRPLLPLPRKPMKVAFVDLPMVTVDRLLEVKRVLRTDEAAWALGVSERLVIDWANAGRLERVADGRPLRVTTESVQAELNRRDTD